MSSEDYAALVGRLRKTLSVFGVSAIGGHTEPLPDQAYRLVNLLDARLFLIKMNIGPDTEQLDRHTKAVITASAYQIVSNDQADIHLDAAAQRIHDVIALLTPEAAVRPYGNLYSVLTGLMGAVGFLLTSLLVPEFGDVYMDGSEPTVMPEPATLVRDARERLRTILQLLDELY